jgi:hypothetical protein
MMTSRADSSQIPADSSTAPLIAISSALQRIRSRLDAGYHTAPIHPYFRDDQRVINDMRRLVFLADHNAVRGVESIPELIDIARRLPAAKQTAIIRLAAAGSAANFTAENITKHARRRHLNFFRVEVERVFFQTTWRGARFNAARSLDRHAYTVTAPKLRATYSRAYHSRFVSHNFHLAPISRFALNYIRWGELDIFNAFYMLKGGFALISYDYTRKVNLLGLRLQENKDWLGIYFIKNHRFHAEDWWRVDFWLAW